MIVYAADTRALDGLIEFCIFNDIDTVLMLYNKNTSYYDIHRFGSSKSNKNAKMENSFKDVLNELYANKNPAVREAVCKQYKNILDILVQDENPAVRAAVAKQGYGLEVLIYDKEQYVSNTAISAIHDNYSI